MAWGIEMAYLFGSWAARYAGEADRWRIGTFS
jgi:hypothetical protein